ncbi:helix-turn-helix domain-containing protein [Streptomyces gibsoniae]|uniref:Helix-turn-helix domain-containing protein n=1 Tax=Streptomyces gibsoniae TaxID=3075529 RepID=A0ABU2U577_9ACTN|nr:helix-turn-helix domain-containing protein [Streptomyces sp. DSM 41699]MDT0468147.1 helix-turn-helix domain-containing protein [Streptomyces sp. DSM 41699]
MHPVVETALMCDTDRNTAWESGLRRWLGPLRVVPQQPAAPFQGTLWASDLAYVRMLSVEADPLRLSRTARLAAAAPDPRLVLALQVSGTAALLQDGHSTSVGPGELAVVDMLRPFSLEQRGRFRMHLIRVPRRAIGPAALRVEHVTGRASATDSGVAALLSLLLLELVRETDPAPARIGDRLAGHVADLLATFIDEQTLEYGRTQPVDARRHLIAQIRRHIDANLRDPALAPATIAAAHRISLRYLHLLFEDEDTTVRKLIQRRRVEECARELTRRRHAAPTISAVARGWGFQNTAHFSRSFKAMFGQSPRDWRAAGSQPAVDVSRSAVRDWP